MRWTIFLDREEKSVIIVGISWMHLGQGIPLRGVASQQYIDNGGIGVNTLVPVGTRCCKLGSNHEAISPWKLFDAVLSYLGSIEGRECSNVKRSL